MRKNDRSKNPAMTVLLDLFRKCPNLTMALWKCIPTDELLGYFGICALTNVSLLIISHLLPLKVLNTTAYGGCRCELFAHTSDLRIV
jgi:hypothetical protein